MFNPLCSSPKIKLPKSTLTEKFEKIIWFPCNPYYMKHNKLSMCILTSLRSAVRLWLGIVIMMTLSSNTYAVLTPSGCISKMFFILHVLTISLWVVIIGISTWLVKKEAQRSQETCSKIAPAELMVQCKNEPTVCWCCKTSLHVCNWKICIICV